MKTTMVKKSDKNNIKKLWAEAFSEQEPFLSWYFDNFWNASNSLCVKTDENELAGALTLIPYDLCINNKILKSSYIAGVSVWQSMRNKGIATSLMKDAIRLQIKRKEPISLLIPFNYDFYRKMGYEVCYERKISYMENIDVKSDYQIKELDFSFAEYINELYEQYCDDKNGYILRKKNDWEYVLNRLPQQNTQTLGCFKNEKLLAYCVYTKEKKNIVIHEVIGESDAKKALISYVSKNNKNVLLYLLPNETAEGKYEVIPTVMARITSVALAMKYLPEANLRVKITDDFLEENNGIFKLGGQKLLDESVFDISTDIKYFTQWFMGFKTANELRTQGKFMGSKDASDLLDEIIKKRTNYINLIMSEDF